LSRGVPDDEFDLLVVGEGELFFEVADVRGGGLLVIELVHDELASHGGFAHAA
jgi:hypothetical protein